MLRRPARPPALLGAPRTEVNHHRGAELTRARGRDGVRERIVALLRRDVPRTAETVRFGVVHAAYPEVADRLTPNLRQTWPHAEIWVRPVTGVLAAHAGPGAWGIFVQVEGPGDEGTKPGVEPSTLED